MKKVLVTLGIVIVLGLIAYGVYSQMKLEDSVQSPSNEASAQQAPTASDTQTKSAAEVDVTTPAANASTGTTTTTTTTNTITTDTTTTTQKTATITYTDSGYSPKSVTVAKGATVTFVNNSSRGMWTASANHPTHTVYPTTGGCIGSTFDACTSVQPGQSWSFTFGISGSWGYHNHVSASDTGIVIVE